MKYALITLLMTLISSPIHAEFPSGLIQEIRELRAELEAVKLATCPPGTILAYGGTNAPPGFLMCDGTQYDPDKYPALFAAIGFAFGKYEERHFHVPDLRGRFLRGVSGGVSGESDRDPDRNDRTAMFPGGNPGNKVGSVQPDEFKAHEHDWKGPSRRFSLIKEGDTTRRYADYPFAEQELLQKDHVMSTGGSETRPKNAYVNFIIKY